MCSANLFPESPVLRFCLAGDLLLAGLAACGGADEVPAVDYVLSGGHANEWLDEKLQPRQITDQEKTQLIAFLRSLTSETGDFVRPVLP
jgi:hypothetical protein